MNKNNYELLIFGGTTEAKEILNHKIPAIYSVATDYGAELVKNFNDVEILTGRLNLNEIINLITTRKIKYVIDATHPFAVEVSANIKSACEITKTELLRVVRHEIIFNNPEIIRAKNFYDAREILRQLDGTIFIATGSKTLEIFKEFANRSYIRVLPVADVIKKCVDLGFSQSQIIAMQGNFSYELNKSMFETANAKILLTKDSGSNGGINAKIKAALDLHMKIILITRPCENNSNCVDVKHAVLWARRKLKIVRPPLFPLFIDLEGEKILIVGGGKIAFRRCQTLLKCGAAVKIISQEFCDELFNFKHENLILITREFSFDDLTSEYKIVLAATNNHELNLKIKERARSLNIISNLADDAGECDFYFPAMINHDNMTITISSGGLEIKNTHKIANIIRKNLTQWLNDDSQNTNTL